jgi:hypothetical protein
MAAGLSLWTLDASDLKRGRPHEIIQPLRLRIMAALNALPVATGLKFARLKKDWRH